MTVADPSPPRAKGRSMFRLLGLVLGSALLLAGGFGAGYFYFANPLSPAQNMLTLLEAPADAPHGADEAAAEEGQPHKVPRPAPEEEQFVTSYYSFPDPLTTNLRESRRFLQIGIGLSTQYDQTVLDNVTRHELALRSDLLTIIATYAEADLADKTGRDRLAAELCAAVNDRLTALEGFGGIETVFFPSFILQ